jgi:hypothetical protein
MADILTEAGRIVKMEVDYTSTCDEKIPECEKLAKSGQLNEAIEALLSLEKQTRTVTKACLIRAAEIKTFALIFVGIRHGIYQQGSCGYCATVL